ncbi:MAG: hypothetical protein ABW167_20085 [Baekduia sp.]
MIDDPTTRRINRSQVKWGPKSWDVIGAVHGRGTLLMGPWTTADAPVGAWVFAPPGVRLATPESEYADDPPISIFGWRQALWMPDSCGNVVIDHGRPEWFDESTFGDVLRHVLEHCPQHLGWLERTTYDYVATLHLQTRRGANGRPAPSAKLAAGTLTEVVQEAEAGLCEHERQLRTVSLHDPRSCSHELRPGRVESIVAGLDAEIAGFTEAARRAAVARAQARGARRPPVR